MSTAIEIQALSCRLALLGCIGSVAALTLAHSLVACGDSEPEPGLIAFSSRSAEGNWQIYTIEPAGTRLRRVTNNSEGEGAPDWSPDGTRIAFDRTNGCPNRPACAQIWVTNADGTGERSLTSRYARSESPAWSPDGRKIAFVGFREVGRDGFDEEIYVMNADGSDQRRLTTTLAVESAPAWSPDGKELAFTCDRGDYAYAICVMNADGSDRRRLTSGGFDVDPDWSPDGEQILFARGSEGSEIFVINADGSAPRNLTRHPENDDYPAWSPDGKKIAFVSDRDLDLNSPIVYVMNADGSGQRRTRNPSRAEIGEDSAPDWAPRGG